MTKLLNTLFFFLISSTAFAQDAAIPESGFMSWVPLIIIFAIFYFLLIRPQIKKDKDHKAMVSDLKIGNNVCTMSGIIGKIKKIDDKESLIFLEVSDGVIITILKASVSQVLEDKKVEKLTKKETGKKERKAKKKK